MAASNLFKKILVPVDNSRHSINAARIAMQIAQVHESQLIFLHVVDVLDGDIPERAADLGHIVVEDGYQREVAVAEALIAGQCGAEVARADDNDFTGAIDIHYLRESINQMFDIISQAGLAEFPKIREIFAHLSRGDPRPLLYPG